MNVMADEKLTGIKIIGPAIKDTMNTIEAIEDIKTFNPVDGGDLMKNINGVETIRRGGHGLDISIRGMSDQRLNTFMDGAMVYGSCSSKMDPASTYVNIENYDSVTLIKGTQSVMFGAGGPGGILSFERITEPLPFITSNKDSRKQKSYNLKLGQTFDSNSEAATTIGDITLGSGNTYIRFNGSYSDADRYQTGTGIKPGTGYRTSDYAIILGQKSLDGTKIEFIYDNNKQENVEYAGLLMDIVYSYTDVYSFKYRNPNPVGPFSNLNIELFQSDMDHFMDNFTVRSDAERASEMKMKTPAASDTHGGRIIGTIGDNIRVGIDYEENTRDAEQNMMISGTNYHLTYLWPGVEIEKLGIFLEKDNKLNTNTTMSYGLRLDQIETHATRAADDPGSDHALQVTANSLYGVTAEKRDFNNLSGFLRYAKNTNDGKYYISFSRNQRTPDATELYSAKTSMMMAGKYRRRNIGNPNLKEETHNTFEFGYTGNIMNANVITSIYHNDVDDYVTTYRASMSATDTTFDNDATDAQKYKNVDATIWGYELSIIKSLSPQLSTTLNLNYTRGDDDSTNIALPQIMPLSGDMSIDYKTVSSNYGIRARFADTQGKVDTRVYDVGKTGGYVVYDLYAGFEPTPNYKFTLGVTNLTDKRYATHLNTTNAVDSDADRVDEPGRSFWGSVIYDF
tara:strand:- start:77142 stop:79181 length:2040 start_codon:yes stop_codon:yes gene_type:complete